MYIGCPVEIETSSEKMPYAHINNIIQYINSLDGIMVISTKNK